MFLKLDKLYKYNFQIFILLKSRSLCVCLCPAMHFIMFRGMVLKLAMGVGDGPTRLKNIFSK